MQLIEINDGEFLAGSMIQATDLKTFSLSNLIVTNTSFVSGSLLKLEMIDTGVVDSLKLSQITSSATLKPYLIKYRTLKAEDDQ